MRRLLGGVLTVLLLLPAIFLLPASTASAHVENVRDDFVSGGYGGSDGSLPWAAPWDEFNESNGSGSGRVKVVGQNCTNSNCLQITSPLLSTFGASRKADLSSLTSATLTFDVKAVVPPLSQGLLTVEASRNGSLFSPVATYQIDSDGGSTKEIDVSAFLSSNFALRLSLSTTVLGLLGPPTVFIDRVNLEGAVQATTTSTSAPTTSSSSSATITTPTVTIPRITVPTVPSLDDGGGVTNPASTTTSSRPDADSDRPGVTTTSDPTSDPTSTTTTVGDTTTTTVREDFLALPPDALPPSEGGLRLARIGLLADYRRGLMGLDDRGLEVLGAELEADFSLAVEVFQAARLWIGILALLVTAAVVSGLDSRRSRRLTNRHRPVSSST